MLNEGFQSAFLALVVLAGIGMALALLLPGRPREATKHELEVVPATAGDRERSVLAAAGVSTGMNTKTR